jgi:predicted alpha/beta superfamily hydrolase
MAFISGLSSCSSGDSVHIDVYPSFQSSWVSVRQVEVFLPSSYNPENSYDVVYMHDGQNVFNPHTSYSGFAWGVEKSMKSLLRKEKIRPALVVAIWNSPSRFLEYMPNLPYDKIRKQETCPEEQGNILSDEYLKFIVFELKPFIDSTYSTKPNPENTFIMGSSMGGLISLYAITEYPDVFGGAACMSTHWPACNGIFTEQVAKILPAPGKHKIYYDYGTESLDAKYEPYQLKVDSIMRYKGFTYEKDWITLKFEGENHSEKAWAKRVHHPLLFFLGKEI